MQNLHSRRFIIKTCFLLKVSLRQFLTIIEIFVKKQIFVYFLSRKNEQNLDI